MKHPVLWTAASAWQPNRDRIDWMVAVRGIVIKAGWVAGLGMLAASFSSGSFSLFRWEERTPLSTPLAGGYALADREKVIYAGGTTWVDGVKKISADVEVYDRGSNRWKRSLPLPFPLAYGSAIATSQGLEILGGMNASGVYRYALHLEPSTGAWHASGTLPVDPLLSRAETIGDEVFLLGGCPDLSDLTGCSDAVWVRRGVKWTRAARLPGGAVAVAGSAVLGSSIYLFGGCSMPRPGVVLNHDEAWKFNTITHAWHRIHALPKPRRGLAAIALDSRRILLAGGYMASQHEAEGKPAEYGFTPETLIYDAETDRYDPAAPLPIAVANAVLVRAGASILAMGGEDRMKGRTPRVFAAVLGR